MHSGCIISNNHPGGNIMKFKLPLIVLILSLLIASSCFAAAPANKADSAYNALLAKVKDLDKSVDMGKFRLAYSRTSYYNPYENYSETRGKMINAFNAETYQEALKYAQALLAKNYTDIDAHFVAAIAFEKINWLKYNHLKSDFRRSRNY